MILSVGGTPVTYGGQRLALPLPRITVSGKDLMRNGQPLKLFGVQPNFGDWMREYFQSGGESERDDIVTFLAGAKACNANVFRLHMELWDFIEGDDIPSLVTLETPFANLMHFLKTARKNNIYVLLAGNNFWHTSTIPPWFDELSNADRWTVSEFYFENLASAIYAAGHSSTILGYELISEPIIDDDAEAEWYQGQFPGTDLYFIPCIARGVATIDQPDAVRDWVTQLATAIRANDPRANVTIGVLPFITGSFGPDNTGDLLDFFSPHIYPPNFLLNPVTLAQAIGYAEDWAETDMPVVIGESSNWSTVESENTGFLDAVLPIVEGYITFYWGYPPSQHSPDEPRYPATSDDVSDSTYALQAEALMLSINYSNDFLAAA